MVIKDFAIPDRWPRAYGLYLRWHTAAAIWGARDPASDASGRSPVDGSRLVQIYRNLGLNLQTIDNPLKSGVLDVWQRMHSGRLKVFASLSKYLDERRLYLRDEKDEIVRGRDHLQDATRCLVNGISRLRTKPVAAEFVEPRQHCGERSWMA